MAARIPNDEQKQVINETTRNILLFASAGTGKTFTVAQRVKHIIEDRLANPEDILCLTFTTKASSEMRIDILEHTGDQGKGVFISTIHGFCYQVLREESKKSNAIYSEPEVIDEVDADSLLKEALAGCGFADENVMESKGVLYPLSGMLKKNRELYGPYTGHETEDYQTAYYHMLRTGSKEILDILTSGHKTTHDSRLNMELYRFLENHAGEWISRYCTTMRNDHKLDFEDLICHVHRAMKGQDLRSEWQKRFRYIIVDEMQDTSEMEYDIIRCLFHGNNAMMCGDYFQTIYEWRGTNPKTILAKYTEEFDPVRICLTHNYRSTEVLCSASFEYLKKAFPEQISEYYPTTLNIESEDPGEKLLHIQTTDINEEAYLITEYLKKTNPEDPTNICILSRTNRNISELYKALMRWKEQTPHDFRFFTVDEEKKFSNKVVIKDILAWPRVILSERTDEMSFVRICKKLVSGVHNQTIRTIQEKGTMGLALTSYIQADTYSEGDPYASLIQAAQDGSIVIYDTETTGLDLGKDQVVQIAAIRMDSNGTIIDKMDCYVIPAVPISKGALATHHISMDKILEEGIDAKAALQKFSSFADGAVLVGHNSIRFDLPLIKRQMKDCGLPELNIRGHYDTMMIAKQFIPQSKNYKLETLIKPFGIVNEAAHDAYGDIKATGELLYRMIQEYVLPSREERKNMILKYREKFRPVYQLMNELENQYLRTGNFTGLIDQIISLYHYEECERESDREALKELKEYMGTMPQDAGVTPMWDFLSNLNLGGSQMDTLIQKLRKVPIITVHGAKGCEFETVIMTDVIKGVFPYYRSVKEGRELEEKRLFYVAISRPKKKLIILSPLKGRARDDEISPYMRLIPDEYKKTTKWKLK